MSQPDDRLTPDEEQVRRLLADARHTEPVPDDVATRLDDVLAGLRTESSRPDPVDPVDPVAPVDPVDLATVRRRRNARAWLVAAAAVVALGVGVNQLDLTSSGSADDSSAGSGVSQEQADSPGGASGGDADDSTGDSTGGSTNDDAGGGTAGRTGSEAPGASSSGVAPEDLAAVPVVRLDSERFGAQVARLGDDPDLGSGSSASSTPTDGLVALARSCRGDARSDAWGEGRVVAVTYDGVAGVVVFRPAQGETRVVDLFLCGREQAERSITLPVG